MNVTLCCRPKDITFARRGPESFGRAPPSQEKRNMFRVATFISHSSIHGFGVFAAEDIPKGTTIWELDEGADWVLTEEEMAAFPAKLQEQMISWTYQAEDGNYVLCSDSAKFMNHS